MVVTHHAGKTDLGDAPEHMCSYVGAAGVVAQIFGERLFTPVGSCEARLYGYRRNEKSPDRVIIIIVNYLTSRGLLQQISSVAPTEVIRPAALAD